MKLCFIQCYPYLSHARSRNLTWHLLWLSTTEDKNIVKLLAIGHYRQWIVSTIKKGNDRYLWSGVKTFTPCAVGTIIFHRENLIYLIVCFTRCPFFFSIRLSLLPICLPCVSCGTYCNEDKRCVVTHRAANIRVAWLVYVRTYCVPIATLDQNKRFRLLYLGVAQIISNHKIFFVQLGINKHL